MTFNETRLKGAFVISLDRLEDDRGFFARTFCRDEFFKHGLNPDVAQCSISFNKNKRTLRGMHFQRKPHEECRLVRCTRGAVYDVIIDLRDDSKTFRQWTSVELNATNGLMLYIPIGFAHGFLTLEDNTELLYQMSVSYVPTSSGGVRWNDPAFGIAWPTEPKTVSKRDQEFSDFAL